MTGIQDVGPAERLEPVDGPVQGAELLRGVRDQHRRRPELPRHVEVLAVEAQHVVHPGPVGGEDLDGIERVDAEAEPSRPEEAHDLAHVAELPVERAPEVDDVGAARAVVLREAHDLLAREIRHVVDLGEDPDVVRAVLLPERLLAEVLREVAEIGGPLLRLHRPVVLDLPHVPLAQPRDDDAVGAGDVGQVLRDPRGGHERGHRDAQDRHLVREVRRHALERRAERGLRELPRDEQGLAHAGVRGGRRSVRRAGQGSRPSPTCWACPPCGNRPPASRAPCPRSAGRGRNRAR